MVGKAKEASRPDIDDQSGKQATMGHAAPVAKVGGIADCSGFSRAKGSCSLRLNFKHSDKLAVALDKVSGRTGTLKLTRLEDSAGDADAKD